MGTKFAKQIFSNETDDTLDSDIPFHKEQIELLSQQDMDLEFNKLYLNSREKLHAMLDNPSEELIHNVSKYLRQNSKSLTECLSEMETYQEDIVDEIMERLTVHPHADNDDDEDYNVPGTNFRHVESFVNSGNSYANEEYSKTQEQQRKSENLH